MLDGWPFLDHLRCPARGLDPTISTTTTTMKYLPTIDLWNPATHAALLSGQLQLQVGQWVRCGSSRPSRFVGLSGGSVRAVHPEGEQGIKAARFSYLSKVWRGQPVTSELTKAAGFCS